MTAILIIAVVMAALNLAQMALTGAVEPFRVVLNGVVVIVGGLMLWTARR